MSTKRQFLDPIGAGCRFILLKLLQPKTKIRIHDHTVQLVEDSILEKVFYRPWIYGDSREDIASLYPMIIRFIELYLNEKNPKTNSNYEIQTQRKSDNVHLDEFNPFDKPTANDDIFESEDLFDNQNLKKKYPILDAGNLSPISSKSTRSNILSDNETSKKCYECLKKIAQYMIQGLEVLEETYEYGNAVFTIQFYINLLKTGINETYSKELLPPHLKDFTSDNLLDVYKIKNLWTDDDIIQLEELFDKCFQSLNKGNTSSVQAFSAAIYSMLEARDRKFKQVVSSTNCA